MIVAVRNSQLVEQVAQPHRERTERVVAAGLGGLTVAQQVGRDDAVLPRKLGDHRPPRLGTSRHSVDQQQRLGAVADIPVCDAVTVQLQKLHFTHVKCPLLVSSHYLPRTATGKARSVDSRAVRTGGWRRCCRAAHPGSGPSRRLRPGAARVDSSSSEPNPLPRYFGSTLSDSISPIREPVTQVSGIHVSSTGMNVCKPIADDRLVDERTAAGCRSWQATPRTAPAARATSHRR